VLDLNEHHFEKARELYADVWLGFKESSLHGFLKKADVDDAHLVRVRALNALAGKRGQSLAQMALAWVLREGSMASALIGASKVEQIEQNVAALSNLEFSADELQRIDSVLQPR